ncbi:MAG: FGGY family carbohydrate kinase [Actinobacteria bacterium]|nr:FGGY family carbohydrate kinase [Actinomycetota bacterium]
MAHEVLVGVDVGTTSVKALCVTPQGEILSLASRATPWRHSGPLADADPDELADVVIAVCAEAASDPAVTGRGPVAVRAIGVTGIAEAGALIDARGEPCAPALAWFDPRGDAASVRAVVSSRDFQRSTGRRLNSKPSLMKVLWLKGNIPSASAAVRHLCIAEWIVRAMGGEEVSEASLASRTGMLDISRREPWPVAVELVGDLLAPQRIWAGDPAGSAGGDRVPDILRGAVLTVAGLDHQAAVFISGAARDGALFDSMGTAEALIRTVAGVMPVDQIEWLTDQDIDVDWSVLPDHQILLGARLTGLSLERIASMLGATDRDGRRALGHAALAVERGDDAPRLVDVSNDALTLGGITDGITPALTWRCAVEDLTAMSGVALEQMASVVGPHSSAVLAGGWTRNPMVADAKARQLGAHEVVELQEPGALGAAFLGGVAAGILHRPGSDGLPTWQVSA